MKPEEAQQIYIPWDGVKPINYPERYAVLLRCFCIKSTSIVYVQPVHPRRRLCVICYLMHEEPNGYESHEEWHSISTRLFGLDARDKICCRECGKILMRLQPAHECQNCIETFMVYEEVFNRFERMRRNWEKRVVYTYGWDSLCNISFFNEYFIVGFVYIKNIYICM